MDTYSRKVANKRLIAPGGFTSNLIKIVTILSLVLINGTPAQTDIDLSKYQNTFAYNRVTVIDKQGVSTKGFFLDLEGDSLKLLVNSREEIVAFSSIKYLKIYTVNTNRNNMINLAIAGAFGAQLLLQKKEWQSDRFIQTKGLGNHILFSVIGALGGGLVGLGIDRANDEEELEYYLTNPEDVQKLIRDFRQTRDNSKLNFYYEIAKVYSRAESATDESGRSYYSYENLTLNLFRSIRLTYDINARFEAGLAMYSAAEPNLNYSTYASGDEMVNSVYGYYATTFYRLLGESQGHLCLKTGLGVGFARIDYTITQSRTVYDPVKYTSTHTTESNNLNKTLFSVFAAVDARFCPTAGVSIALTGDYVFIPEKTPQSNLPGEGEKLFGNFSLGLSLGLHF